MKIKNSNKIIDIGEAGKIARKLHRENKSLVLVGGCFDIIHIGHIAFLKKAKDKGDILILLLESDESVRKLKGKDRPVNSQQERADVLAEIEPVDYIVKLPVFGKNEQYDTLILQIKPHVIATTKGDPQRKHKTRQARLVQGKVLNIIQRIYHRSTTKLAKQLYQESL